MRPVIVMFGVVALIAALGAIYLVDRGGSDGAHVRCHVGSNTVNVGTDEECDALIAEHEQITGNVPSAAGDATGTRTPTSGQQQARVTSPTPTDTVEPTPPAVRKSSTETLTLPANTVLLSDVVVDGIPLYDEGPESGTTGLIVILDQPAEVYGPYNGFDYYTNVASPAQAEEIASRERQEKYCDDGVLCETVVVRHWP